MSEDPVEPQEIEQIEDHESAQTDESILDTEPEQKQVPLSALQKERKKRQELEQELYWERQKLQKAVQEPKEDDSRYETATREDLGRAQEEAMRMFDERLWIRNNPDKYEQINELLPQFLKQRPHLASAIKDAPNRYEEAYTLMNALNPRPQQRTNPVVKRDAPNGPASVPKGAALSQAVDVMTMSDKEYAQWRQGVKRRR